LLNQKAKDIKAYTTTKSSTRRRRRDKPVSEEQSSNLDLKNFKQENVVLIIEGSTLALILGSKGLEE